MGRQSARLYYRGKDHKEIYYQGHYHKAMYRGSTLLWEKIDEPVGVFMLKTMDVMMDASMNIARTYVTLMFAFEGTCTISWGDGTTENLRAGTNSFLHRYPTQNGTVYDVIIRGKITQFTGTYLMGSQLASITEISSPLQESMYAYYMSEKNFVGMFQNCYTLRKVTAGLFDNFAGESDLNLSGMFQGCGLVETPSFAFSGLINANITGLFEECPNLTTISASTFDGATYQEDSTDIFTDCANLKYVHDYPPGINIVRFSGCNLIEEVDLRFRNNKHFSSTFYGMRNLKNVPEYLFAGSPDATSFYQTFRQSGLTEIPEGLFDNLSDAQYFNYCFAGTPITTMPIDLFDDCYSATDFTCTFLNCGYLTSSVPALWERTNVTDYIGCFEGCTNVANYDSIPEEWR